MDEKSLEEVEICKQNQIRIQNMTKDIFKKIHNEEFSRKPYGRTAVPMNRITG